MDSNPSVELAPLRGKILLDLDEFDESLDDAEGRVLDMEQTLEEAFQDMKFNIDFTGLDGLQEQIDSLFSGADFSSSFEGIESAIRELSRSVRTLKGELSDLQININTGDSEEVFEDIEFLELKIKGLLGELEELKENFDIAGDIEVNGINGTLESLKALEVQIEDVKEGFSELGSMQQRALAPAFEDLTSRIGEFKSSLGGFEVAGEGATEATEDVSNGFRDMEIAGVAGAEGVNKGSKAVKGFKHEGEDFDIWTTMALITPLVMAGKTAIELGVSYQSGLALTRREFGLTQAQAVNFANTSSKAFDLSRDKALELTDQFGLSFKSMGANDTQAQSLSNKMVALAQNMNLASGGSISLDQATQALTNMLGGQAYGMEALGFATDKTKLNQLALNSQWHEAYAKMTPLQQATIELEYYQNSLNKSLGTLKTNSQSAYGKLQTLKAQLSNTGETIGNNLLPLVLKLGNGLEKLLNAFSKLSPQMQNFFEILIVGAVAFKPMKAILGKVAEGAKDLFETWGKLKDAFMITAEDTGEVVLGLGDLLDPITAVITAVGLLYEAWKHNWFNIRGVTHKALTEISTKAKHQFHNIENTIRDFNDKAYKSIKSFGAKITKHYDNMVKGAKTYFSNTEKDWTSHLSKLQNKIKTFGNNATKDWDNYWKGVGTSFKEGATHLEHSFSSHLRGLQLKIKRAGADMTKDVKNIFNDIKASVEHYLHTNPFGKFIDATLRLFKTLYESSKQIFNALLKFIISWAEHYAEEFSKGIENISHEAVAEFKEMGKDIENTWHDFTNKVSQIWNTFKSTFNETIDPFIDDADRLGKGVENKVKSGFKYAVDGAKAKWNELKSWYSSNITPIINDAEKLSNQVSNWVKSGFTDAKNHVVNLWNDTTNWFDTNSQTLVTTTQQMGTQLSQSTENSMNSVKNSIVNGWNDVCGWWSSNVSRPVDEALNQVDKWGQAGEQWIESLWNGMRSAFTGMLNWLTGGINHIISDITNATGDITGFLNSHDGSHAVGLGYVPWDGYSAQLHKGEMVLTAEEAEAYRSGSGGSGGAGNTYNFYSPKTIDPFEARHQIEALNKNLANGFS